MPKGLFSIALLMVCSIPAISLHAQEKSDADQLRALELQVTELYKERKIDRIASLLDDDFVITFEDGNVYSKTGYISYNAAASVRILEAETLDVKVHLHGNTAVLIGVYHERGDEKGKPYDYRDRFTDVWMKKDGKWKLIASHYAMPAKD
jgi:ketosteroid isomerase-like protein